MKKEGHGRGAVRTQSCRNEQLAEQSDFQYASFDLGGQSRAENREVDERFAVILA